MNRAGLGIAIGIGDRGESFQQAQQLYSEYKTQLSKYMNWVTTAPNAVRTGKNVVLVNGQGVIDESMTGAVSSLISSSKLFGESKVTVVTTLTKSGEAKISTRATERLVQQGVNLRKIETFIATLDDVLVCVQAGRSILQKIVKEKPS